MMTFNISVSVMSIFSSLLFRFLLPKSSGMKIVYSIQFWFYLCNQILRTIVNVSSAKEKIVYTLIFDFSFQVRSLSENYEVLVPELDP